MMILFSALALLPVAAGTWGSTTAAASTGPWYQQAFSSGAAASSTSPAPDNKASDPFGNPTASATIPAGRGQFFGATVTAAGAPTGAEVKLGGSSSSWGSAVNAFSVASAETESRIFGSDSDDTSGSGKGGKSGKGSNSGGAGEGA